MDFGWALDQLKAGKAVKRSVWEDTYIFLVEGSTFRVSRAPLNKFFENGTEINYSAHIDIKMSDGGVAIWPMPVSSVLANDWVSA
jgi:hypothetical protein